MLGIGCLLPWNFFSNAKQVNTFKSEHKHNTQSFNRWYRIFTARKRSCGKIMFFTPVCHSVHGLWGGECRVSGSGSGVCVWLWVRGCVALAWGSPPWSHTPSLDTHTPGHTLRSTSGRYASYWNDFLFKISLFTRSPIKFGKNMSHFAYARKMRYPLNLVLENSEYLWFYWTFCIVILDYGLKLHKLSNHTLVILQKWLEIH